MRSFTAIAGANNTSARRRRAGHRRGAVRHRHRPVRGDPGGDRLQPLTHGLDRLEARLGRFADRFHATLSRELEVEVGAATDGRQPPRPRARHGRRRAPMAEINVTPLVDVMLVLLIIFMVTAPLLVAGVPVDLPESRAGALDQQAKPVQIAIDGDGGSSSTIDRRDAGHAMRELARASSPPASPPSRSPARRPPHLPAAPTSASITAG
jgi:biopolymer transport protein TolR